MVYAKFMNSTPIDDYDIDGGLVEVFCVVSKSLCTCIGKNFNKFAISHRMALNLDMHKLRSCLRLICECELYILANEKVSVANDHGKN